MFEVTFPKCLGDSACRLSHLELLITYNILLATQALTRKSYRRIGNTIMLNHNVKNRRISAAKGPAQAQICNTALLFLLFMKTSHKMSSRTQWAQHDGYLNLLHPRGKHLTFTNTVKPWTSAHAGINVLDSAASRVLTESWSFWSTEFDVVKVIFRSGSAYRVLYWAYAWLTRPFSIVAYCYLEWYVQRVVMDETMLILVRCDFLFPPIPALV